MKYYMKESANRSCICSKLANKVKKKKKKDKFNMRNDRSYEEDQGKTRDSPGTTKGLCQ